MVNLLQQDLAFFEPRSDLRQRSLEAFLRLAELGCVARRTEDRAQGNRRYSPPLKKSIPPILHWYLFSNQIVVLPSMSC